MTRPFADKIFPRCIFVTALCVLLLMPSVSHSSSKVSLNSIDIIKEEGHTSIVINLSGNVEFSKGTLNKPERLFINLKQTTLSREILKSIQVGDGMLKSVRIGQFSKDTSRIVFEMENKHEISKTEIKSAGKDKIIVDVFNKTYKPFKKPIIVIDAGHGGHDPGAIGPKSLREKDITLAIALRLKKLLENDKKFEVFLTRDKDEFLELPQRTGIANKKNADLFVSVHVNANTNPGARGVETYLLNWTDDEGAMKVAARENSITLKKMKEAQSELSLILASLQLQTKRDESIKLANLVQNSVVSGLKDEFAQTIDLGVKQAMFYVLVDAKMPSVLVEVSFISNPLEEKLLRKKTYQERLANGIAEGIGKYLEPTKLAKK